MPLQTDLTLSYHHHECVGSAASIKSRLERLNVQVLVLFTTGGTSVSTTIVYAYKHLAFLLSVEDVHLMSWLCYHLSFSLLQSALMYIGGFRYSSVHPLRGHVPASIDLALKEGCLGLSKSHFSLFFLCIVSFDKTVL